MLKSFPITDRAPSDANLLFARSVVAVRQGERQVGLSYEMVRIEPGNGDSYELFGPKAGVVCGYVLEGAVRFQIPELGVRAASAGHWFVVSVMDFPHQITAVEKSVLCLIRCHREFLNSLNLEETEGGISCLWCAHRSVSMYQSKVALGEVRAAWGRLAEFNVSSPIDQLYCKAYMYEVVGRVMEDMQFTTRPSERCEALAGHREGESLYQVAAYLEWNLAAEHSLVALSRRFGLNECKLKREFKVLFGTTVFGYLRRRRMEEAARLLRETCMTVLEVAAEVGYSNPSHFARAFVVEFGCLPKEFRRQDSDSGNPMVQTYR